MSSLLSEAPTPAPLRLEALLEELSSAGLDALAERTGVELDPSKRLTPTQQLARALGARRQLERPAAFSADQQALIIEVARRGGRLLLERIPESARPLLERGWLFERAARQGVELAMPAAYMLTLPPWEGEDRRALRVVLPLLERGRVAVLARHFDPRLTNLPTALALEPAFVALRQPKLVRSLLAELSPVEAELLRAVVAVGGEVDTEELLDLAREPMRLQVASGVTHRSGGASFELERRGLLLHLPPNRHLVPSEVRDVVGERQQRALALRRAKLRRELEAQDFEPGARARFSGDPAPLAMALALLSRERKPVRQGVGTPRTLLAQLSSAVGADVYAVALLSTLSRKVGLWDAGAAERLADVGVFDLSSILFDTWLQGVGWDEGRVEPELLRAAKNVRQPSPSAVLHRVVVEDLVELAASCWVPLSTFVDYCLSNVRALGLERQLERFVAKANVEVVSPRQALDTMLRKSLTALGVVDVASGGSGVGAEQEDPMIRATARALAWLVGNGERGDREGASRYVASQTLRIGADATVAEVLAVGDLVELGNTVNELELIVSRPKVERAVLAGASAASLRERLMALAPPSAEVERLLESVALSRAHVEFVAASGFVWVDDPDLLSELREARGLSKLFVEPSPPGGLLVAPSVRLDRLSLRLRRHGVELRAEEGRRLRAVRP